MKTHKLYKKASREIDLSELFKGPNKQDERIFSKHLVNVYEFYLTGEIESADKYIHWFDTIRHASDNDVIKMYINSPGGDVFTAIQMMRALNESGASIIMSVEGACISAATMILLCGESFEIADHSTFMVHTYSGGSIGKGNEIHSQVQHERGWSIDLIRSVYEDFLTPSEMDRVIDGVDIWMDGDEVIKRLEARANKREQEAKDNDEKEPDPVPQKRSRKAAE